FSAPCVQRQCVGVILRASERGADCCVRSFSYAERKFFELSVSHDVSCARTFAHFDKLHAQLSTKFPDGWRGKQRMSGGFRYTVCGSARTDEAARSLA